MIEDRKVKGGVMFESFGHVCVQGSASEEGPRRPQVVGPERHSPGRSAGEAGHPQHHMGDLVTYLACSTPLADVLELRDEYIASCAGC